MKDKPILVSVTKRKIQIILGFLWLLDGLLQLQSQMFTANFANNVISPNLQGEPVVITSPIHLAIKLILLHPAIFNVLVIIIQIGIGLMILMKKTVKPGLILSIIWGLGVWFFGESLGGIIGLHSTVLMGFPGAVLIYMIIAFAVFPSKENDKRPASWLPIAWALLWVAGSIYQLLPGQNTSSDLSSMILNNSTNAPSWLARIDVHTSNTINRLAHLPSSSTMHTSAMQMSHMQSQSSSNNDIVLLLIIVQILIGLLIFFRGKVRTIAIASGFILSLFFWVVGQGLGNYFSGLATDPNSAPLYILLGISIFGCSQIEYKKLLKITFARLEQIIT